MKINRKEFLDVLSKVDLAIANNETIEQSSSFIFKNKKVYAFNGEIASSASIPYEINGAIRAKELIGILSKYKSEELDIDTEENKFVITSGKSKAGLIIQQEIKIPFEIFDVITEWENLSEDFVVYLKLVSFAASKDFSQPQLSCIHITSTGIEASDNYRIAKKSLDVPCLKGMSVLVPIEFVPAIVKNNPIKCVVKSQGWLHFINEEDVILSVRLAQGEFPSMDGILETKGTEFKFPNMAESLDKAIVFTGQNETASEKFIISIDKKNIKIRGENEVGWFEEKISFNSNIENPFSFHIRPDFLKEILSKNLNIYIADNLIKFEDAGFIHCCTIEREQ